MAGPAKSQNGAPPCVTNTKTLLAQVFGFALHVAIAVAAAAAATWLFVACCLAGG